MDLRAFYFQAAQAAATATEDDDMTLTPKLFPGAGLQQEGQSSGGASPVAMGVNSDVTGSGAGARDLICPECGKAFPSDKALYGHLRCHPGRRNKGTIRPATPVASASSVARGDAKARKVLWMEDDLPTKWPLTAKRGRTPTVATSVSVQPVSVLESTYSAEEEAANTLLDLSQQARNAVAVAEQKMEMIRAGQLQLPSDHVADPVASPDHEQPVAVVPDMAAGADALQHVQVQEREWPAPVEHIFGIILQPKAPVVEPSSFIAASEPVIVNNSALVVVRDEDKTISPGAKKPKKRRLHDPVSQSPDSSHPPPHPHPEDVRPPVRRIPSPASDRRYACPSCYKSFPTHQALGGHMASHNRAIRCAAAQQVDGLAVARAVQNILAHRQRQDGANASASASLHDGEDLQISLRPPKPVSHICVRCRQIFATGQALGGHMRKHFLAERLQAAAAPPALAAAAAAMAIAPPAPAAAAAVPVAQYGALRDFDLNEMLPWE
ncbi:hypothetical protein D1007_08858 [Hordeum vulgare]|uniref:Predicted protein n=1 Tax=Hordeum vulgare subsp. vulgare TaxID=112509 RepID=F2EB57_HORVV|nr:uncharacterized protein LOC123430408 [Hordeum vulgare subsp. vulgare]KAE8813941.1 hypothetical protein D1007_08858 [Hordeum vulgare]BAK04579.1 predicted protein [Hordeum vulgare subsp. vulgare]